MATDTLSLRFDRLDGCEGSWILDLRDSDNRGYDLHHLPGYVYGLGQLTVAEALQHCKQQHWRDCRLLFSPARLNDDCSWPGGYDAPSIYRSNARVFRDEYRRELELADGDADGIALDLRYVTDEMLETIEALEGYPLLSEEDHSELELELQSEAWDSWAAGDWRRLVCAALDGRLPKDSAQDGDEILDGVPDADDKLRELFEACRDAANVYWQEESDGCQWIDLERIAAHLDVYDLRDLTGLALLDAGQEWRREPYPWPDGSTAALVGADA